MSKFVFKTSGRNYEIGTVTGKHIIDIEVKRAYYASNNYGGILFNSTKDSVYAMSIIDTQVYLEVFCPGIFKDMVVDNIQDLELSDLNNILEDFEEQFNPWIKEWRKLTNPREKKVENNESSK